MYKITIITLFILTTTAAVCQAYTLDQWVEAIYAAECGTGAKPTCTYLYGIRSVKYKDKAEARAICKRTVERTLYSRRAQRCKAGESDIDCLSRRYAPIGSGNDPGGLNRHWAKNVLYFLNKG